MKIATNVGPRSVCVMIPTKDRATILLRNLRKMPWLNEASTYIGVEAGQLSSYGPVFDEFPSLTPVCYTNPTGSIGYARQRLLLQARHDAPWAHFVVTDDNARYRLEAFVNLVRCAAEFPSQPAISIGYHSFMKFCDAKRKELPDRRTINGISSFEHISAILMCLPHEIMRQYNYPDDAYAMEDRHLAMWCLAHGFTTWRICQDAPFTKSRFQKGGSGSVDRRQWMAGISLVRLASDFPQYMGINAAIRSPWKDLLALARGKNFATRPPLGSNRSHDRIRSEMVPATRKPLTIRRTV